MHTVGFGRCHWLFVAMLLAATPSILLACSDDGPIKPRYTTDAIGSEAKTNDLSEDAATDLPLKPDDTLWNTGIFDHGPLAVDLENLAGTPDDFELVDVLSADERPDEPAAHNCPTPGALIFTEFMADPDAATDAAGEYLELFNTSSADIDLRGLELHSGAAVHLIRGDAPALVPANGVILLAASGDTGANGGIWPGYVYDKIRLSNTGDDFALVCDGTQIDRVVYIASKWGIRAGHAMTLDPSCLNTMLNDASACWCNATTQFGAGDFGSPALANQACP